MKKSEIVIGNEYTERRGTYGTPRRVRVVGEAKVTQGYGYSRKTISGSRALVLDSKTGQPQKRVNAQTGEQVDNYIEVPNRQIQENWVDYAERTAANLAARASYARSLADDRDARSRVLLDLIPALRHAGYGDDEVRATDPKVRDALAAHVDDCLVDRPDVYDSERLVPTLVAPLARNLIDYVASGTAIPIKATDLLRLLDGKSL